MKYLLAAFFVALPLLFSSCSAAPDLEVGDTIVVGTNAEFPPFTYIKDGEIVGFDIDVVREVTKRLGFKMRLVDLPFDALIPEISLGSLHMVAAGMTPTPERAHRVHFSKPYLKGDPLVMLSLKRFHTPSSLKELDRLRVVVNTGYTADAFITDKVEGNPLRLATPMDGFLALQSRRADVFVTAKNTVTPFLEVQGNGEEYVVKVIDGSSESVAMLISKKHPQLVPKVNEVIAAMIKDGTMDRIKKKWGVS